MATRSTPAKPAPSTATNAPMNGQVASELTIHQRMGAILSELPAIGKDSVNQQQGFKFRGIDDVLNKLNPLLSKYGVFYLPEVLERVATTRQTKNGGVMYEVNLHVCYRFYGPLGDSVRSSAWGEGTDSGDKSTNKAMTGAMKQALFQAFAISTEETSQQDTDRYTPDDTANREEQAEMDAKGRGFKSAAEQKAAHESVTADVRELAENGLLTDADKAVLKSEEYRPSWPMTKVELERYASKAMLLAQENADQQQPVTADADDSAAADDETF